MRNEAIYDAARKVGWSAQFLDDLNAVLHSPGTTPMGAYCLGVVTIAAHQANLEADRKLMEDAAACDGVQNAVYLAKAWIANQKRRQRRARKAEA